MCSLDRKAMARDLSWIKGAQKIDMNKPVEFTWAPDMNPDGELESLTEYKAPTSLYGRLFKPRRIDLPDKAISFNLGRPVRIGDVLYDPLEHVYSVIKCQPGLFSFFTMPADYDYDGQAMICTQYRIAPSRFQSLIVKLVWFLKAPLWIFSWIKSHLK